MTTVRQNFQQLIRNKKIRLTVFLGLFASALIFGFTKSGITIYQDGEGFFQYQTIETIIRKQQVVVDVDIKRCVKGFSCHESKVDNREAKPRQINIFSSSYSLFNYYLYVTYSKKIGAPKVVVDIRTTSNKEEPQSDIPGSQWTHKSIGGVHLWINYLNSPEPSTPIIRDVDLFFGQQDLLDTRPYWGFSEDVIKLPVKQTMDPRLSLLKISPNQELELRPTKDSFSEDGIIITVNPKFKIVQLNDLHIAHDASICDGEHCKYDAKTLDFILETFEKEEDVQLVVITGDMIETSKIVHFESAVLKALSPILKAKIPFIFTFGNSDIRSISQETTINMLNFISSLPGCHNKQYANLDHRINGLTNGDVKIFYKPSKDLMEVKDKTISDQIELELPNALITYLDSKTTHIDETQSSFIYRTNAKLKGSVYHKLLFTHFPLPDFRPSGKFKLIGSYNEKHKLESLTDKAILADLKSNNYKVVGVGHEHENDACIWNEEDNKKILLCYGGVTGDSAETLLQKDFKRRLRVYELDFETERILSWKRDIDGVSDTQLIWSLEEDGADSIVQVEEAKPKAKLPKAKAPPKAKEEIKREENENRVKQNEV